MESSVIILWAKAYISNQFRRFIEMENNISWVAILGAITGVLGTLGWIVHYIVSFITKPKLVFSNGPYARRWHFLNTTYDRCFVNFEVGVKNKKTARRCVATAKIIKKPNIATN